MVTPSQREAQSLEELRVQILLNGPFASFADALGFLRQRLFANQEFGTEQRVLDLLSFGQQNLGIQSEFGESSQDTGGGQDTSTDDRGTTDTTDTMVRNQQPFRTIQNTPVGFDFSPSFSFNEPFRQQVFQDDPAFAFQTAITEAGLPRQGAELFRRRAGDFLGQFQGQLGKEFSETGQFQRNPLDFFRGLNLAEQFAGFGPRERGESPSLFNPRTRSLLF